MLGFMLTIRKKILKMLTIRKNNTIFFNNKENNTKNVIVLQRVMSASVMMHGMPLFRVINAFQAAAGLHTHICIHSVTQPAFKLPVVNLCCHVCCPAKCGMERSSLPLTDPN